MGQRRTLLLHRRIIENTRSQSRSFARSIPPSERRLAPFLSSLFLVENLKFFFFFFISIPFVALRLFKVKRKQ
jgi:hypothetical protein